MRAAGRFIVRIGLGIGLALGAPLSAAEPAKPPAWDLKLGFSYLATTGNADTVRGFQRMDTSTTASLVVQLGRK